MVEGGRRGERGIEQAMDALRDIFGRNEINPRLWTTASTSKAFTANWSQAVTKMMAGSG
jgi:hypothetical protein